MLNQIYPTQLFIATCLSNDIKTSYLRVWLGQTTIWCGCRQSHQIIPLLVGKLEVEGIVSILDTETCPESILETSDNCFSLTKIKQIWLMKLSTFTTTQHCPPQKSYSISSHTLSRCISHLQNVPSKKISAVQTKTKTKSQYIQQSGTLSSRSLEHSEIKSIRLFSRSNRGTLKN